MSVAPGGFIAIAGPTGGPESIWLSSSGSTWTRLKTLPMGSYLGPVASLGGLQVAVGNHSDDAAYPPSNLTLWTSSDSQTWSASPPIVEFEAAIATDSTSNGARVVVIGESDDPNASLTRGYVWVAVRQ